MIRARKWRLVGWGLLPAAAAAQGWTPPAIAERWYAARLYPHVVATLATVTRVAPFSLAEMLLALFAAAACVGLVVLFRRRAGLGRRLLATGLGAPAVAGYLLFAFVAAWGINYRRPPLSQRLRLSPGGTAVELRDTARWLASQSAALAPAGPSRQPTRIPYSRAELDARIEAAYARLGARGGIVAGPLGRAKPVLFSGVMSRLGISGIYSPLTGEANYNRLVPDSELPFAIAHEKAHQRGIAPENEANFVAFLALQASDDPYLRYSGALNAGEYVLGAVARTDPDAYRQVVSLLTSRPIADMRQAYAFWRRYRGPAQRLSHRVNDLYLRANRVPGGIQSYDAVTDLLVGYHRGHP